MKKMKIVALLLWMVIAVAGVAACGQSKDKKDEHTTHEYVDGVCTECGEVDPDYVPPCEHNYVNGVCNECGVGCEHDYTDGVCNECGIVCEHDYTDGVCNECGIVCEHDYTDGVCNECGIVCEHDYTDGVCGECGEDDPDYVDPCDHNYVNGVCTECTKACRHDYENGVCVVCGNVCTHEYENGVCNECDIVCEHDYTDGVCNECGIVCEHDYTDGVCGECGIVCEHDYTDGVCNECGIVCEHDYTYGVCGECGVVCEHDYTDGVCSECGIVCEHDYTNGVCNECGVVCEHDYTDGVCSECGVVCEHDYTDGVCDECGVVCEHEYTEGVCDVCGLEDPTYVPADGGASIYQPILEKFKQLALYYDMNGALPSKGAGEPAYVDTLYSVFEGYDTSYELGYTLRDITGEGYLELVIMSRMSEVYAIFTIAKRTPVVVATFTQDHNCFISAEGLVYYYEKTMDSNDNQIGIAYHLKNLVGTELVGFEYGWVDGDGDGSNSDDQNCYEKENGVKKELTYDEYRVYPSHIYEYQFSNPTIIAKFAHMIFQPVLETTSEVKITADFSSYDKIIETFSLMYSDAAGGKFDKTKWRNGEYDNGMAFNSVDDYVLYNRLLGACVILQGSSSSSDYGYMKKDLNSDGVEELLLFDEYGTGDRMRQDIFAIFTQVNGKPILLDMYDDLRYAYLDADGKICVAERVLYGHKKDMLITVYEIKNGALSIVSSYGYKCDVATTSTQIAWYKVVDGAQVAVSQSEFNSFYYAQIGSKAGAISISDFGKYNAQNSELTLTSIKPMEE